MSTGKKITRLSELADSVGGKVLGDGTTVIEGVCSLENPVPGHIGFAENPKREATHSDTVPAAMIVKKPIEGTSVPLLVHENPRMAFTHVMRHFHREAEIEGGIHPSAWVDPDAEVDSSAWVGPFAVIESGAGISARACIGAGAYVGKNSVIGEDTRLAPNCTVMHDVSIGARCIINPGVVIGSEGFGFVPTEEGNIKVPQIGRVEIGDDCEIGANTTIDRATLDVTKIDNDVKIDNLVQIAHNCRIGRHTRIAAQAGLSGRVVLEENIVVAGQAGFQNGITVGKGSIVAGRAGVTRPVKPGSLISGYPARDHRKALALLAAQNRLPEILERLDRLEEISSIEATES